MAHKTLVGGTAYEISGGKTLIGGTAYSIARGKTLVGGTAYDISFLSPDPILANNDPATIQKVVQNGQAENYWSIGDIVPIVLNGTVGRLTFSNETYYAFIIGFNHNIDWEAPSGSVYSIHFQFGKSGLNSDLDIAFTDTYYGASGSTAAFRMNTSRTNAGGWESSYMRSTICPAFLSAMPSTWQNVISACAKYSDNTGGGNDTSSYVTATSDKIWLLSEFEVYGANECANSNEQNRQKQYAYYKNGGSKTKYYHDNTEQACYWWTRSVARENVIGFVFMPTSGLPDQSSAYTSRGFAPGFMVA